MKVYLITSCLSLSNITLNAAAEEAIHQYYVKSLVEQSACTLALGLLNGSITEDIPMQSLDGITSIATLTANSEYGQRMIDDAKRLVVQNIAHELRENRYTQESIVGGIALNNFPVNTKENIATAYHFLNYPYPHDDFSYAHKLPEWLKEYFWLSNDPGKVSMASDYDLTRGNTNMFRTGIENEAIYMAIYWYKNREQMVFFLKNRKIDLFLYEEYSSSEETDYSEDLDTEDSTSHEIEKTTKPKEKKSWYTKVFHFFRRK